MKLYAKLKAMLETALTYQTIDDYAHKRAKEIAVERTQPVTLPNGRIITKGTFIDTQQKYELDDEETTNYIMMRWYDNLC